MTPNALFQNISRWLETRTTRQDYLICAIMGALNALAMPPVYFFPILLVTFPILFRLLDKSLMTKQVVIKTFLFFFTFHVAGLYWISAALFVDIANNWWVLPFALSGLPMLMAAYPALLAFFWHRLAWQGSARLICLIVLFAFSEWLRGWVFTGFPWNLWGYAWVFFAPLMQSVALIGVYGLTILTLIFACLPVFFFRNYQDRFGRIFCMIYAVVMVSLLAYGLGRLATPLPQSEHPFNVRIVQPNIKQEMKWSPEVRAEHEQRLWRHTIQPAKIVPDMVIWPETAITLFNTQDVWNLHALLDGLLPEKTILAAGMVEAENDADSGTMSVYNRISFYNKQGHRLGYYDKAHLVPFGEYLPFQKYWPVKPVAFSGGGMQPGTGIQTIHVANLPAFSALICYEVLFPGAVIKESERPAWILNITNDAWYGNTSGPYQHLAITRTRAIEEGLPVVRTANTGISAVIDPMGRIIDKLPLNSEGIIDQPVPASLKPTLFARFGNSLYFGMLLGLFCLAWFWQKKRVTIVPHIR